MFCLSNTIPRTRLLASSHSSHSVRQFQAVTNLIIAICQSKQKSRPPFQSNEINFETYFENVEIRKNPTTAWLMSSIRRHFPLFNHLRKRTNRREPAFEGESPFRGIRGNETFSRQKFQIFGAYLNEGKNSDKSVFQNNPSLEQQLKNFLQVRPRNTKVKNWEFEFLEYLNFSSPLYFERSSCRAGESRARSDFSSF